MVQVLNLEKGLIWEEWPDIDEEVESIKKKMEKHIYGKTYAGYCRACGKLVVKGFEAYISQLQGDKVVVDVYHKIHL